MKTQFLALIPSLLFLISPQVLQANCQSDAVMYQRSSGFGLKLGGNKGLLHIGSEQKVGMPVSMNGQPGCYQLKTKLSAATKTIRTDNQGRFSGEVIISTPTAHFQNIPGAELRSYLMANHEEQQVRFSVMTYTCAGNQVIGFDAITGNLQELQPEPVVNVTTQMFIATGSAATALRKNLGSRTETLAHARVLRDFAPLLTEVVTNEDNEIPMMGPDEVDIFVPEVFTTLSMEIEQNRLSQSYESVYSGELNACREEVARKLAPFSIEHLKTNPSLVDFQVRKSLRGNEISIRF